MVEGSRKDTEEKEEEKCQETVLLLLFFSRAFLCLFCKHRQGHDQNTETMR